MPDSADKRAEPGPVRRFLKHLTDAIGLIPVNPRSVLFDRERRP
jgi:hypothetical protein